MIVLKLLVCVDGSKQGWKALNKAIEIASGCSINEVTLIHVYESVEKNYWIATGEGYYPTEEDFEKLKGLQQNMAEKRKKMLDECAAKFKEEGINPGILLEEGHPAHTIARIADDGNYDMIIMGNRGLGGLKKIFLGSVSNAVIQETKASVLVVK
ncbi:universal stress protein [Tindallia californiensis]|uniref:universal stress protein n=1 Tax=Tindallia californiensis TaxID=159292 RepID=UPI000B86316E|nr:universal stress protein [Tindallia californiensis]